MPFKDFLYSRSLFFKAWQKSGIISLEAFVFDLAVEYWVQCD